MLVLSRRTGQKIVIGNEITIEIVSVSGDGVRLGISAPESTSVHRFEIFAEIQHANEAATVPSASTEPKSLVDLSSHLRSLQNK